MSDIEMLRAILCAGMINPEEALAALERVAAENIAMKREIIRIELARDAHRAKLEKAKEALISLNNAIDGFWNDPNRPSVAHLRGGSVYEIEKAQRSVRSVLADLSADAPALPPQSNETDAEMLHRLGDDASKWAAEFNAMAQRLGYRPMDEGWLLCWFANAIEHSDHIRRKSRAVELLQISDETVEAAAQAICRSGKFECGLGRCAPICASSLGYKPEHCVHAKDVHGELARAAILAALEVERKK